MTTEQLERVETDPLAEAVEQTPPEPASEAAPETGEAPEQDGGGDLAALLKGLGLGEGSAPAAGEGTQAAPAEGAKTYTQEEFDERVTAEVRKRDQARLNEAQKRGLSGVPQRELQSAVQHLTQLGATQEQMQPVIDAFNRAVGAALPIARTELTERVESQLWQATAAQIADETERKAFADRRVERHNKGEENLNAIIEDFAKTVRTDAQKNRFTKQDVDKAKTDAQRELIDKLVKAGVPIPGYKVPETGNAAPTSGTSFNSAYENDRALNEGRITPAQWKANNDRLRPKG